MPFRSGSRWGESKSRGNERMNARCALSEVGSESAQTMYQVPSLHRHCYPATQLPCYILIPFFDVAPCTLRHFQPCTEGVACDFKHRRTATGKHLPQKLISNQNLCGDTNVWTQAEGGKSSQGANWCRGRLPQTGPLAPCSWPRSSPLCPSTNVQDPRIRKERLP